MQLLFVGDCQLGRLVNQALKTLPPEYPWGDTLKLFENANFRICNLECVISDRGRPWRATPKVFHFRTDAKNVEVLKAAKIDAVSLANNHTLDFEEIALFDTLEILRKAGIAYAGAGKNSAEASSCAVVNVTSALGGHQEADKPARYNDIDVARPFMGSGNLPPKADPPRAEKVSATPVLKIGLIAFTDNEPDWEAGPQKPGVFYVPVDLKDSRAKKLLEIVQAAKHQVDFLIVSAHWGPNWGYQPPREHPGFARALIEAGADLIFGHSGHVFRGIEIYQGKPILYSTGDFIDDYAVDEIERNDQSFIFMVEVGKEIERLKLYPTLIENFQARMAQGQRAREIAKKMQALCEEFKSEAVWQAKEQFLEIKV